MERSALKPLAKVEGDRARANKLAMTSHWLGLRVIQGLREDKDPREVTKEQADGMNGRG
jgi:hypothetical protein